MSERVTFLIDGFNLFHSIRESIADGRKAGSAISAKWLNLKALCDKLLVDVTHFPKGSTTSKIRYFTALATHLAPDKVTDHKTYISALDSEGVLVAVGNFKRKEIKCPKCNKRFVRHEEKETDVNIGIALVRSFLEDECDTAVILSGDTDLVSAVLSAKQLYPKKRIGIAFPYRRHNNHFQSVADFTFKLKTASYINAQFGPTITCSDGTVLTKPPDW